MSGEATNGAAKRVSESPKGRPSLHGFVATLQARDEIADLILHLEAIIANPTSDSRWDPGVKQLAEHAHLNLDDRADLKRAILALGARAEILTLSRRDVPTVVPGDLAGLGAVLVASMEVARLGCPDDAHLGESARACAEDALLMVRRNSPPRNPKELRWWDEVASSVRARLVPAYVKIGAGLNRIEDNPVTGLLLRSPIVFALLLAIPGLITIALPVSTPLVCLVLGLVGAYVVHPMYLASVAKPLLALRETLAAEGDRIARASVDDPWPAETFEIEGALRDLMPILEGERLAGRASENELRATIGAWADHATQKLEEADGDIRAFSRVRALLESRLARSFSRHAAARARMDSSLMGWVLDSTRASAAFVALLTFPISILAVLISPFPPVIDLPLMVALFAALGWWLPSLLPGTEPALEATVADLIKHQTELDRVI